MRDLSSGLWRHSPPPPSSTPCHGHKELMPLLTSIKTSNLFVRRNYFHLSKVLGHILTWSTLWTQVRKKAALDNIWATASFAENSKMALIFRRRIMRWTNHCAIHVSVFPEFSMLPTRTASRNRDIFGLWCKVCGMCRCRGHGSERKFSGMGSGEWSGVFLEFRAQMPSPPYHWPE